MKHLRTFESYEDKDLESLADFNKGMGLQKRRVDVDNAFFGNPKEDEHFFPFYDQWDMDKELNWLDKWSGPGGVRVKSLVGDIGGVEGTFGIVLSDDYVLDLNYWIPNENYPNQNRHLNVRGGMERQHPVDIDQDLIWQWEEERLKDPNAGFFETILKMQAINDKLIERYGSEK